MDIKSPSSGIVSKKDFFSMRTYGFQWSSRKNRIFWSPKELWDQKIDPRRGSNFGPNWLGKPICGQNFDFFFNFLDSNRDLKQKIEFFPLKMEKIELHIR